MALDPTKVTNKSTAMLTKRTEAFEDAAADLNLAVLRIDETSPDPETAKRRVKVAKAILTGDDTSVRQAVFGDLSDDDRQVVDEVFSGRLTKANLEQLRQQSAQAAQPATQQAAQQPQVIQGNVVTPSQELTHAVDETSRHAEATAGTAQEAKESLKEIEAAVKQLNGLLNGAKKDALMAALNKHKAKVEATATATSNTKDWAVYANSQMSGVSGGSPTPAAQAPATQAMPAAPSQPGQPTT